MVAVGPARHDLRNIQCKGGVPCTRKFAVLAMSLCVVPQVRAASSSSRQSKCSDLKDTYKAAACCGKPAQTHDYQVVPNPVQRLALGTNPCEGKKPTWPNMDCWNASDVIVAMEQAGADVSPGVVGTVEVTVRPLNTTSNFLQGLCPVNVHWHLGAEHRVTGQFDENGKGPLKAGTPFNKTFNPRRLTVEEFFAEEENERERRLAADVRYGYACHHYDKTDAKFTTPYNWQHCKNMHVGETYEMHWPHSALGACGTPWQYQLPFYDGVFCNYHPDMAPDSGKPAALTSQQIAHAVGVHSQVFTIVNDENYYYPNLMKGMIVNAATNHGQDVIAYTGSSTGTSRGNTINKCSPYSPVTWKVDRTCHMISASSFDKLCADMKQNPDDMTGDIVPHGSRETVFLNLTANNIDESGVVP